MYLPSSKAYVLLFVHHRYVVVVIVSPSTERIFSFLYLYVCMTGNMGVYARVCLCRYVCESNFQLIASFLIASNNCSLARSLWLVERCLLLLLLGLKTLCVDSDDVVVSYICRHTYIYLVVVVRIRFGRIFSQLNNWNSQFI